MPALMRETEGAAFGRRFSLEATRPSLGEIADTAAITGQGCALYLSAVPGQTAEQHAAAATQATRAGLMPVPHLAARRFTSTAELTALLTRLRGEADVRRALVIGGDGPDGGPFADALALILHGALAQTGIEEVGIAGYPEGHPQIPPDRLAGALREKIAAARAQGLQPYIVSQFSFAPEKIVAWIKALRAGGIDLPIKVGMAGPTSLPALLRYAKRCGVNASLRGLGSGVAASLLGNVGPDRILEKLAATDGLGDIAPHYFSFGGLAATAQYAQQKSKEAAGLAAVAASRR